MSDGGRGRASLGVEVWKSSPKWSVQRSAVRSIAWLDDFGWNSQIRSLPQVSVKTHAYIRCDEQEKKIESADLPTESPESDDDKSEGEDAQESLDNLACQAVEE